MNIDDITRRGHLIQKFEDLRRELVQLGVQEIGGLDIRSEEQKMADPAPPVSPGMDLGETYDGLDVIGDDGWVPDAETLIALMKEMKSARAKFPDSRCLLAAIGEEYGELNEAVLEVSCGHPKGEEFTPADIRREALQVACTALRLYEEGDSVYRLGEDCEPTKAGVRFDGRTVHFKIPPEIKEPIIIGVNLGSGDMEATVYAEYAENGKPRPTCGKLPAAEPKPDPWAAQALADRIVEPPEAESEVGRWDGVTFTEAVEREKDPHIHLVAFNDPAGIPYSVIGEHPTDRTVCFRPAALKRFGVDACIEWAKKVHLGYNNVHTGWADQVAFITFEGDRWLERAFVVYAKTHLEPTF